MDRRQSRADARVIRDRTISERHVEVNADEDLLPGWIDVPDRPLREARHAKLRRSGNPELRRDERGDVSETAGVTPLVVVPGDDLHGIAENDRVDRTDDR